MKIFHIIGCECSGRIVVAGAISLANKNVAIWDIYQDFYIAHEIMTATSVDWTKYRSMLKVLEEDLTKFIKKNKDDKHIIIVSTGINPNVNKTITTFRPIVPVVMEILSNDEMKIRAEERDADPHRVIDFSKTWQEKTKNMNLPASLSEIEATRFIQREILNT